MADLKQKQALPLEVKILLTRERVRQWIDEYGEDGVYISFSGGKDSTVLLDLIRNRFGYKDVKAVFCDTGLEYPEIREFVKTFDNVDWIKPKMNFRQVIQKYGYPFASKEISESVEGARKYLREIVDRQTDRQVIPYRYYFERVTGTGNYQKKVTTPSADIISMSQPTRGGMITNIVNSAELASILNERMKKKAGGSNQRLAIMLGMLTKDKENPIQANIPDQDRSQFSMEKWQFLLDCPWEISNKCCNVMKKNPNHSYSRKTKRMPITGEMAQESRLRTQKWVQHGCNMFDAKHPKSCPMSFWTENDVLQYIYENKLPICSVYGEIVKADTDIAGQMDLEDWGFANGDEQHCFKTTGCSRTGCMFCGYGCHLEKEGEGRFERMKVTHPKQYEYIMKPWDKGGLGYKEIIDWLNEHGNLHIRY